MKSINLQLTVEELKLLTSLASDQVFRREFIDPKMPGYKGCRADVDLGKALIGRMRAMIGDDNRTTTPAPAISRPMRQRVIA